MGKISKSTSKKISKETLKETLVQKIRGLVKHILSFIQYFIIELVLIVYYLITGIFTVPGGWKIGIAIVYAGVFALLQYDRRIIFAILALVIIAAMLMALFMAVTTADEGGSERVNNDNSIRKNLPIPYFEGMNIQKAKEEYSKLLELYCPDNGSGDLNKLQEVVVAYSRYCSEKGCR